MTLLAYERVAPQRDRQVNNQEIHKEGNHEWRVQVSVSGRD
jgi:hypothetical protein